MITYKQLNTAQAHQVLPDLGDVLQACVADGASVGFTDPADRAAIDNFWQGTVDSLDGNECDLLIARDNDAVVATVMIDYCGKPNGRHRAEICKLLVHPAARQRGIARQLMTLAEQHAWDKGITLLVLDTRSGDVASQLYLSLGWQIAGEIPAYAESIEGRLDATTYMYKLNNH
ncbi:GNAT family N-acetyltransferase [Pseudescherichia sp.]|uniref:GNAT family N-acetyltransferase n=1 Tax=Pseudescherichia sp. TaxID=2055881 RepID=UPI002896DDE6|nr:GNAT family N-acetyltransferase [Pseudescherichia sp.]